MNKHNQFKIHKLNQNGFGAIEALLVILIVGIIGGAGFYVYKSKQNTNKSLNNLTSSTVEKSKKTESTSSVVQKTTTNDVKIPDIVDYDKTISMTKKSDVSLLINTSQSFKDFIASKLPETTNHLDCGQDFGVGVKTVYKDQMAVGGVGGCGGAIEFWKKDSSGWKDLIGTQQGLDCIKVKELNIPRILNGTCMDWSDEKNPITMENPVVW